MKKGYVYLIFINTILALLQTSLFLELFGNNLNPNLILAFAFAFLVTDKTSLAFFSALSGGLILDSLSSTTPGLTTFVLVTLMGFSVLMRRLLLKNYASLLVLVFCSTLLNAVALNITRGGDFEQTIVCAVLTTAFAVIISLLVKNLVHENKYL